MSAHWVKICFVLCIGFIFGASVTWFLFTTNSPRPLTAKEMIEEIKRDPQPETVRILLTRHLRYPSREVKCDALLAILFVSELTSLHGILSDLIEIGLRDTDLEVRNKAIDTCLLNAPIEDQTLIALVECLADPITRQNAIDVLSIRADEDDQLQMRLIAVLSNAKDDVRKIAYRNIPSLSPAQRQVPDNR